MVLCNLFNFERLSLKYMGLQLSWLERTPDKREVDGSSPFKPTMFFENCIQYIVCINTTSQEKFFVNNLVKFIIDLIRPKIRAKFSSVK